jgi:hypothetical protein
MRTTRWIAVALAAAALLTLSAAGAQAAIVRANPGGEITMRSLGRITLNTLIYRVECRMTLRGRFFESARGDLAGELTRRPNIGEITSGSVEDCTAMSTVRLLMEGFFPALFYVAGISEARRVGLALLNFRYLIRIPMLFECLWDALLMLFYDGDLLEVRSITQLGSVMRLTGSANSCPIPPTVVGRWDLEPDQELTLEMEI